MANFLPLPPELQEKYTRMEAHGYQLWTQRQFLAAARIFQRLYEDLKREQPPEGRFQKGGPLFNRGTSLLYGGERVDSVAPIVLAFIEDCLSEGPSNPSVDTFAAAKTLREVVGLPEELLKGIRETVEAMGNPQLIRDPQTVYEEFLKRRGKSAKEIEEVARVFRKRRTYRSFDMDWDKRVFIGGGYRDPSKLEAIRKIVMIFGYEAVIAMDFDTPEDEIRHHALMLLHSCKYAIFDMAIEAGQLIEIDRCLDYQIAPLILYPASDPDEAARITAMVKVLPFKQLPYRDDAEMTEAIRKYLAGRTGND